MSPERLAFFGQLRDPEEYLRLAGADIPNSTSEYRARKRAQARAAYRGNQHTGIPNTVTRRTL